MVETFTRLARDHAAQAEQQKKVTALLAEEAILRTTAGKLALAAGRATESLESAKRIESLLREKVDDQRRIRSLEEHRQHLQDGQPCPLCGSMEHPWSSPEAVPADSAEEQLRKQITERERLEKEAAAAREQSTSAERHLAQHHARTHAIEEGLFSARSHLEAEWQTIASERECTQESLTAAKAEAIAAHAAMASMAASIRAAQEEARTAATAAAKAAAEAELALSQREACRLNLAAALTALHETEAALTAAQTSLAAHLADARRAFAEAGEPDAVDLPEAMERLKKRERLWRENTARAAELEKRAAALRHEQERILDTVKTWETRAAETAALLAKASIVPVAAALQKMEWNGALEALTGSLNTLQTAEALATDAANAAERAGESLTLRQTTLTEALAGTVFDSIDALKKARIEKAALQTIHLQRDALREEGVRLQTRREVLSRDTETVHALLEEMHPGGKFQPTDLPGLELEQTGVSERVRALHAERGAVEQQLRSDDEMRSVHAASATALEEMKRNAAPWSRLNELIGSAGGDKFSRFAQAVTLEHLTTLANARLVQLCDRYRLLRRGKADDLELQISDAWQGDSLRPMESLSGGETFLVSLALALGLSELAGGRSRIGTLFIDEGFGTLDSTALDIALSSLETLRTGHSAIGVISHVEILKARLTTQVEVVRGPGGWGHLEVRT
jgi:exonuclease SbcC